MLCIELELFDGVRIFDSDGAVIADILIDRIRRSKIHVAILADRKYRVNRIDNSKLKNENGTK